jgi:hypothetical protein
LAIDYRPGLISQDFDPPKHGCGAEGEDAYKGETSAGRHVADNRYGGYCQDPKKRG